MKATINNEKTLIIFTPESGDEREALKEFAMKTTRPHLINFRGFNYLDERCEFLVQPMPSRD